MHTVHHVARRCCHLTSRSSSRYTTAVTQRMYSAAKEDKVVVSIEGNIGSGKSTLLRVVAEGLGAERVEVKAEPVDRWTDCRGENLLHAFYEDPKKYSYCFQSFAFISRLMVQQQEQEKAIRVMERSPLSDYCFARNCYDMGLMTKVEWAAYNEWWSFFVSLVPGKPKGVVYLRTEPEVCFSRVNHRKRAEEAKVELSYLQMLHDQHEEWLPSVQGEEGGISAACTRHQLPYVVLDGNQEFEGSKERQEELLVRVKELIAHIEMGKCLG